MLVSGGGGEMGKGRRLRQQRQSTPLSEAHYPFVVDAQTATKLGREGLAELALNLWPKDCQTCGWGLGELKPTVRVVDLMVFVSASLHHARCQPAEWTINATSISQPLLSYATLSFLLPIEDGSGRPDDRPVFLVNPSLEQVALSSDEGRWTATTVALYRQRGLRTPGRDFVVDALIPDMVATLDDDELTVTLDDTGETWTVDCSGPVGDRVRELGGIILAITTAADPHRMLGNTMEHFVTLMQSDRLVLGWIALAGTEKLRPLQETEAPSSVKTYLLHWGATHSSVGELLATTDRSLSVTQAQAWALAQINSPNDTLIPWDQPSGDPHAWYTLDAISITQYFLRRHTDAWKLLKVLARVDGVTASDETEVQDWATRAVRIHGDSRIVSWVPGPSTAPGFTTLHGAGTPR